MNTIIFRHRLVIRDDCVWVSATVDIALILNNTRDRQFVWTIPKPLTSFNIFFLVQSSFRALVLNSSHSLQILIKNSGRLHRWWTRSSKAFCNNGAKAALQNRYIFGARDENQVKTHKLRFEHGTIITFSWRPMFPPKSSTPLDTLMACDLNLPWWGILKVRSSKHESI